MHRCTAALLSRPGPATLPVPSFWWTAFMHSPLDHLAENATFVETSRLSSRQTAAKNLIVMASSRVSRTNK
jgi:hypothetical protein